MKQNISRIVVVVLMFFSGILNAQEKQVSSLLSNYGLGTTLSESTVVERAQGGLSVVSNSVEEVATIANPALLSDLRLTSFSLAFQVLGSDVKTQDVNFESAATSLANISLGIPLGNKGGFSAGLRLNSAVGFEVDTNDFYNFGNGSVNQVYIGFGYKVYKGLSVGAQINRFFGRTEKRQAFKGVQNSTVYDQTYNVKGGATKFGVQYKHNVNKKVEAQFGAYGVLEYTIDADGESRFFEAIETTSNVFNELTNSAVENTIKGKEVNPFKTVLGLGLGEKNKWFAGLSYEFQDAKRYSGDVFNQTTSSQIATAFEASNKISLGGYIIPEKYALRGYFKRVVYRAGFNYGNTGLLLNNNSVKNIGMSFGIGLPVGKRVSYANFTAELGKLGHFSDNKYQESYLNVGVNFTLSDKWFLKRVID